MTAHEIHNKIQVVPLEPTREAIQQILDILTWLNDRDNDQQQQINSTQATARHADNTAAGLANGVRHHG